MYTTAASSSTLSSRSETSSLEAAMSKYTLGIDMGTTTIKVCILDVNREVVAAVSHPACADIPSDYAGPGSLQDVPKIIDVLHECIGELPKGLLEQVTRIGICGQMHGVVLWKVEERQPPWVRFTGKDGTTRYRVLPQMISPLYTWQDGRCDKAFLQALPQPESHLPTHTGFGLATLFWLWRFAKSRLMSYNCAGTIQDFVVAMLCGLQAPCISVQNAASWGYFDCLNNQWNLKVLEGAGFPVSFLPKVCQSGHIAGDLCDSWMSIPIGTYMSVALGDVQCSVLATLEQPNDAILNISTSAQLCFIARNYKPKLKPVLASIEYFPYFENEFLAVAASLNGGNVLSCFVNMVQGWTRELGHIVSDIKIWETVNTLARQKPVASLKIQPTLLGEHTQPDMKGSVTNITSRNLSLGSVFHSLCEGLVENLSKLLPRETLENNGVTRVVGIGSGLIKNEVLQSDFQRIYKLPLIISEKTGDSSKGAAIAAMYMGDEAWGSLFTGEDIAN